MRPGVRTASTALRIGLIAAVCFAMAGCGSDPPLARAGVTLSPPTGWRPSPRASWPVPGTPLAAWSGPDGASLVAYRTLPDPGADAGQIAASLANRLANLPGLTVVARAVETWGGARAARVEVIAPGTGDALAPTGTGVPLARDRRRLLPTRGVIVGIPDPDGTLFLAWHAPESANERLQDQVRTTLEGLRLERSGAGGQSY